MSWKQATFLVIVLCAVAGCATVPTGPSVAVMPPQGKPLDQFQSEDVVCRQWAEQQIRGMSPGRSVGRGIAGGAAIGSLAGAGLGAAVGAATGNVGAGAAIGGATGAVGGAAAGSGEGRASASELQRRYDIAYQQCMYSKGNRVPSYG